MAPAREMCSIVPATMRIARLAVALALPAALAHSGGCGESAVDVGAADGGTSSSSSASSSSGGGSSSSGGSTSSGGSSSGSADAGKDAASGLVPSGCVTDVSPGDHAFTCDGYAVQVRLPVACKAGGCGAILDVHGATMNAAMEDANTNMRAIGEREGYVVVQPSAKGTPPSAVWNPGADYDKVWAAFSLVRSVYKVDPKKVHVTGFSQGGRMTFTFACKYSAEIASAAPAGEAGCTATELGAATREVPLLHMHGTEDVVVSYGLVAAPQRDAIVSTWAMGSPTTTGDGTYTRAKYVNGKGTVYEHVSHGYAASSALLKGHCYPGSGDPGTVPGQLFSFACTPPNGFVWGEEVVAFFKAHPLP